MPITRGLLLLILALALGACVKATSTASATAAPLMIGSEDVLAVRNSALASGPVIVGSIQPERKADLRAEVQAVVLQVLKENGDAVKRGDLLVRLDDTAIRDALASAQASERAAQQALDQAQRQFERMKTLRASGMASAQALDDAEGHRNSALSDLEAAKARVVLARQQMQRTEVRAPFDGLVSERKASAGDSAQVGKELLKVIDPTSMRFEGLVSSDQIGAVKAAQSVTFRVNGYGEEDFRGRVRRVNPAANATTRQVEVLVDFTGKQQPRLAGLYAEGRVETASSESLTLPASALVRDGDRTSAWRVAGNKLQKVPVVVGDRDPRHGDVVVKSGLAEGDQVIRYPSALLKEGQPVQVAAKPATSMLGASETGRLER
ncbi:MAG TPA: efflux RND transporter periplasmic adaptor subunit [Usitatibacter sp.]|jgi:RND family efflux transporter MFP subunit|nr:efflux RND transporter periplasmic adaptor subunit [Usitatibacter sp.]